MSDGGNDEYFQVRIDTSVVPAAISASGELDVVSAGRLTEAIDAGLASCGGVVLDLGDVSFVDSSGLRAVTIALRSARDEGHGFEICAMSDAVRRVVEMTGVDRLLEP